MIQVDPPAKQEAGYRLALIKRGWRWRITLITVVYNVRARGEEYVELGGDLLLSTQ